MEEDRREEARRRAGRGKYRRLHAHLCGLPLDEWRTTFGEVESVAGLRLPPSARLYREWWGNHTDGGMRSQALAWSVAGWETAQVDIGSETLVFRRTRPWGERRPQGR